MAKISIDHDYCQAHGRCYARFPALFDADEEGKAVVTGDGTLPEATEESEITGVCPEAAITVS
ncbi:ferredoxin [Rhodococcus sp. 14C212]|uniref:ferredoxin n=1 Tax=Rhodococcus sp. 14C212 TaxID=2711209 RepID=UPI0013EC5C48|nr:ferredoxin [Rhodococcus sp. 14C212]NGP08699.1 ferredoxin [Rhodococcus sp. 14C212]